MKHEHNVLVKDIYIFNEESCLIMCINRINGIPGKNPTSLARFICRFAQLELNLMLVNFKLPIQTFFIRNILPF